tara:strand:+ start:613 stop:2049 length:1437 start_codon:yes stop_codon:yes gene_type:complete
MSKGGGGGGPQTTESTVTQTNLPEYAEPYFTRLMQRSEAESLQPYRPYTGQRLAQQSPAAQRALARQTALGLSSGPAEMNQASDIARGVASAGSATAGQDIARYDPSDITSAYQTGTFDSGYNPANFQSMYDPANFQENYDVERFTGFIPAQQYQSQDFGTDVAQRYMNPFQQMVTDIEKREAARSSDIMGKGIGDAATRQGGLGGYREAIVQAERERNLGQQLGDIQARGQRDAFAQAQDQFERDRASRFGAASFGEQQRQAMEQTGLSAAQFAEQQRRQDAQFGLTAQEMADRSRQFATTQDLSAQEMADRSRQFGASQTFAEQQARDAAAQFADRQRLAAQQADIDANIRSRQLGLAGLGADQATQQQRLASAQLLAAQAPMQQQLAFDRLDQAQQAQEIGRNFQQAGLDMGYQDYLNQLAYPRQQLGFQSQILQGLPVTPGTQVSSYQPQASGTSQLLGLGLGALGLQRALGGG